MKVRKIMNFTQPFLLAIFLLFFSAASGRAEIRDGGEWVQVSINAGETYLIENIKLGTKPEFRIAQNPNAFLSYETAPGKLTMLGAEAGRWVVTVTNSSDKKVSYDLNAFAVAKPGHPLSPGILPPSLSDSGLDSRPGFGAPASPRLDLPELATISSLRSTTPSSTDDFARRQTLAVLRRRFVECTRPSRSWRRGQAFHAEPIGKPGYRPSGIALGAVS